MLAKIILNVAYKDKDQVKKLGAKWDPQQKIWYVPPGLDPKIFKSWQVAASNKPEIIISQIGLVRNMVSCWSCKGFCTVYAVYARSVKSIGESEKTGFYILSEIAELPDSLAEFLSLRCRNFKLGKASPLGIKLYRNHCDHCKIGFSDARLHKKGHGFNPGNALECKTINFIDLLFFDELNIKADLVDYTDNKLFLNAVLQTDYLTDFI